MLQFDLSISYYITVHAVLMLTLLLNHSTECITQVVVITYENM